MTTEGLSAQGDFTTIVIPTRDNAELVTNAVESILRLTSVPFEVIVVDNASTRAESREAFDRLSEDPRVRVLCLDSNRFYWPAVNAGVRCASPLFRHVLALNDDCIVLGPRWIQSLLAVLEEAPEIGFAGDLRPDAEFRPLGGWVDGYCVLFRREVLEKVGPFDERHPFNWGFVDFQLRAYRMGYRGADIKKPGDARDEIRDVVRHLRGRTIDPLRPLLSDSERTRLLGSPWTPARLLARHGFYREALGLAGKVARSHVSRALHSLRRA